MTTFTRQSQSGICDLDTPRDTSCLANWQGWKTFPVMAKCIKSSPLSLQYNSSPVTTVTSRSSSLAMVATWLCIYYQIYPDFRYLDKTEISMYQDFGGAPFTVDTALASDKEFQAGRWRSERDEHPDTGNTMEHGATHSVPECGFEGLK